MPQVANTPSFMGSLQNVHLSSSPLLYLRGKQENDAASKHKVLYTTSSIVLLAWYHTPLASCLEYVASASCIFPGVVCSPQLQSVGPILQ
jgi:hypothetical protein